MKTYFLFNIFWGMLINNYVQKKLILNNKILLLGKNKKQMNNLLPLIFLIFIILRYYNFMHLLPIKFRLKLNVSTSIINHSSIVGKRLTIRFLCPSVFLTVSLSFRVLTDSNMVRLPWNRCIMRYHTQV